MRISLQKYGLSLILVIIVILTNSCEKNLETHYLTEEEKKLGLLYVVSDTIMLKDREDNNFTFYISNIDSGISESDFLGIPQYKSEWTDLYIKDVLNEEKVGSIRSGKPEGIFDYLIVLEFSDIYFKISYRDKEKYSYKLQKIDQLEINGISYQDVYIFNNATSETAEPTQKIYLNTEYGFLKLEDLEKDMVYTIVRE